MQKTYCRVSAKEERLKQSPLFVDFERKIASLSLAMTGKTVLLRRFFTPATSHP